MDWLAGLTFHREETWNEETVNKTKWLSGNLVFPKL
jgi:hypothetical protein